MKICTKCRQEFPPTGEHFYRDPRLKSGLRGMCKTCHDALSSRYYSQNKEKVLDWHRQYHMGHREEHNARMSQYQQTPQGRIAHNAANQRYSQTERGKLIRISREHKRRARKYANGGSFTPEQFQEQIKRQKHRCYYCRKRHLKRDFPWQVEHVVPVSRGGTNNIDNIVAACSICNLRKRDRLPHEWPESNRLM